MFSAMTTPPAGPSRRPTPRPTFTRPTVVRRSGTAHHVWGDAGSGLVTDRVYVSTDTLHVLEYELAPGGEFRHSARQQDGVRRRRRLLRASRAGS